eukprot:4856063-Prymnesium_polylepis.1
MKGLQRKTATRFEAMPMGAACLQSGEAPTSAQEHSVAACSGAVALNFGRLSPRCKRTSPAVRELASTWKLYRTANRPSK